MLLPGVAIGTGASIGANAMVTRDVISYEIVAEVLVRHLRLRFREPLREHLFDETADMTRLGAEDSCALREERLSADGSAAPKL